MTAGALEHAVQAIRAWLTAAGSALVVVPVDDPTPRPALPYLTVGAYAEHQQGGAERRHTTDLVNVADEGDPPDLVEFPRERVVSQFTADVVLIAYGGDVDLTALVQTLESDDVIDALIAYGAALYRTGDVRYIPKVLEHAAEPRTSVDLLVSYSLASDPVIKVSAEQEVITMTLEGPPVDVVITIDIQDI